MSTWRIPNEHEVNIKIEEKLPFEIDSDNKVKVKEGFEFATSAILKAPILSGPENINENSRGNFTIDAGKETDVYVEATHGTISSLDINNGTFIYMAPDITDNENDLEDEIKAYYKVGTTLSETAIKKVTVKYVALTQDDAIQVVDFSNEASINDGFEIK